MQSQARLETTGVGTGAAVGLLAIGIADELTAARARVALPGASLVPVAGDGLAALCVAVKGEPKATVEALTFVQRVLETAHALGGVVPLCFGGVFEDREAVGWYLRTRSALLRRTLDRLRDTQEFSVRLLEEPEQPMPGPRPNGPRVEGSGSTDSVGSERGSTEPLPLRVGSVDHGDRGLGAWARSELSGLLVLAREWRAERRSVGESVACVSVLVGREDAAAFVERFAQTVGTLSVPAGLAGPGAPSSFATLPPVSAARAGAFERSRGARAA